MSKLPLVTTVILLLITPWFWQLFQQNHWLGLLIFFTTPAIAAARSYPNKFTLSISLILLTFLLAWQLDSASSAPLDYLDNDQQRIQQIRLRAYPPLAIPLLNKPLPVPLPHWLESRPETITYYRLKQNFFQLIDPPVYFFAGHPREKIGIPVNEKFTFIWLPFSILGFMLWLRKPYPKFWIATPLVIVSLLAWRTATQQPFALLPFIAVTITEGVGYTLILMQRSQSNN